MRQHLRTCSDCREVYDRSLVLEQLEPTAPGPQRRLGQGLGLQGKRRRLSLGLGATGMVAAAVALVAVLLPSQEAFRAQSSTQFSARGHSEKAPSLQVYRVGKEGVQASFTRMEPRDELAFAFRNPAPASRDLTPRQFLMVFAVDHDGRVHWYHPAWTSSADNPASVPIQPGYQKLKEAIAHDLLQGSISIYGLFSRMALRVKHVEQLVKKHPNTWQQRLPQGSVVTDKHVQVQREP